MTWYWIRGMLPVWVRINGGRDEWKGAGATPAYLKGRLLYIYTADILSALLPCPCWLNDNAGKTTSCGPGQSKLVLAPHRFSIRELGKWG